MIKTIEDLDEIRARVFSEAYAQYDELVTPDTLRSAQAIRDADEAAGLNTEALLAVLRGEAVIVPKVPTEEMWNEGTKYLLSKHGCWAAMLAASPWAKKEGV